MISDFFSSLYFLTSEMAPYLLLGFLIAGILKVYVPQKFLTKNLGKSDFKSVLYAAMMGVPLPLCSCGVIPTGISLRQNGASNGATISFLISTPQTGIDSIMITYSMLGWPFALIRPIVAFITGIFGGFLANFFDKKTVSITSEPLTVDKEIKRSILEKFLFMLHYAFVDFMADIAKWLAIGLVLAAFIDVIIPSTFIQNNIGNPWIEMLFALVISIPLYICATGSVPLAAVLLLKGLSPGAAFVLLMAGPATNMATITVISRSMGLKNLIIYLFSIIVGAIFFGSLINYLFPENYFNLFVTKGINSHIHESFSYSGLIFSILLFSLILYSFYKNFFHSKFKNFNMKNNLNQYSIIVEGMSCQHCEANVVRNLSSIKGVSEVIADKSSNIVSFTSENPEFKIIEEMINSLGYEYKGLS
jgi:uncharacterized protein